MTVAEAIAAAEAAERACDAAGVIFRAALARVQRSKSERNRRAYIEASDALEDAADRSRAAQDAIQAADRAERYQAARAARLQAAALQVDLFA